MNRIGLTLAALIAVPGIASACGGFFCSQVQMDQAGEHILFAVEGENVTAHIKIDYEGAPTSFSWVLPVPSTPEIAVGSDLLFARLRTFTDPSFRIQWENPDGCDYTNSCSCQLAATDGGGTGSDGDPSPGPVEILAEGDVGPFTFKVVGSEDGEALFAWLNDNGYDQPEDSKPIVGHYVNQSYVFVAIKLQSGKSTGDIQPLVLKYTAPNLACVPLKLTSIAASPDMPVFTWVLARARAIPLNFFHVLLNAKAYDWLNCATEAGSAADFCGSFNNSQVDCDQHYLDLVTQAANAANGHAFVTEYAGTTSIMDSQLYIDGQYDLEDLKTKTTPGAYLQALLSQGFPRDALMQEVIKTAIPKPAAVVGTDCEEDRNFYAPFGIDDCLQYMDEGYVFDPLKMTADVEARMVKPLMDAQQLFTDFKYMTRMFTTISADEMTKDPMFSFNPDLPDVSNVHTITGVAQCKPGSSNMAEKVTLKFADGGTQVIEGEFSTCSGVDPASSGGSDGSVAFSDIQVLNESGPPESIPASGVLAREAMLDMRAPTPGQSNVDQVAGGTTGTDGLMGTSGTSEGTNSGCTTANHGSPAPFAVLFIVMAVAVLRIRTRAGQATALTE